MKTALTLIFTLCMFNSLLSQSKSAKIVIKGTMFSDDPGKEPIEYGTVWIQGTHIGSTTDKNGNYSFDVTSINDTAKVYNVCGTYISCHAKCVTVKKLKKSTVIDFGLKPEGIEIEDKETNVRQ